MFDNVGKSLDEDATKRSFTSVLISSLLIGAGTAFFIGYGSMKVVEEIREMTNDDDMVEVVFEDVGMEDEAPPPPPPPPPPPAAATPDVEETETDDTTIEVDEMIDTIKELDEEVKTEVKSVVKPKGVEGGVEDGVEDGVVGGVKDGVKDGVIGGVPGARGVRMVHNSQLRTKVTPPPRYPEAAESMNLGRQRCKVKVKIDEKGIPYEVKVSDCPKVFHEETRKSILKWRWYPYKDENKKKVKAETLIAVVFQPR